VCDVSGGQTSETCSQGVGDARYVARDVSVVLWEVEMGERGILWTLKRGGTYFASYSRCPAALARKLEAGVLWLAHVAPKRGARGRTEGRDVEVKRDEREAGSGDLALKRGWMGSKSPGDARRRGRGSWGCRNEKGAWPEEARVAVSCSLASKEQFPRGDSFLL